MFEVAERLKANASITNVAIAHCEPTLGVLNSIEAIAELVAACGRSLLIDAVSPFAALPLGAGIIHYVEVVASANKCLEEAPGVGFMIVHSDVLEGSAGNAHSLSLDMYDQWVQMEKTGQWRYTPPTYLVGAFDLAIVEHRDSGRVTGPGARYADNRRVLVDGAWALGLEAFIDDNQQSPIIVTLHSPDDVAFGFKTFYGLIKSKGFIIYPGKITVVETFRVGCIGQVYSKNLADAVTAMGAALDEMGDVTRASVAWRLSG